MTAISLSGYSWKFVFPDFYLSPPQINLNSIKSPAALLAYLNSMKKTNIAMSSFNLTGTASDVYKQILQKFATSTSGTQYSIKFTY
jgi:hypothetical protein